MHYLSNFSKFFIFVISYFCLFQAKAADINVLYSSTDMLFGPMWVFDEENMRCLSFDPPKSALLVQSCVYKDNPDQMVFDYTKLSMASLYINKEPKKILMLGFGGAIMSNALNKIVPKANLHVVEINPNILTVAEKYFFFNHPKNTEVFIDDGFDFVMKSRSNVYDIIIVDAFGKSHAPVSFLKIEFVEKLKKCLKPGGVVVVNLVTKNANRYYDETAKLYQKVFKTDLIKLVLPLCTIILVRNGNMPSMDDIKRASAYWEKDFTPLGIDTNWLINIFPK